MLVALCGQEVRAQNKALDSLRRLLASPAPDTLRVRLLTETSRAYWRVAPDTAEMYALQALQLAQSLRDLRRVIEARNSLAASFFFRGDNERALAEWQTAAKEAQESKDSLSILRMNTNIGLIYQTKGAYQIALEYYFNALEVCERLAECSLTQRGIIYNNIGILYEKMEDYTQSLVYHRLALRDRLHMPDGRHHLSSTFLNMGICFVKSQQPDSALFYYRTSLALKEQVGDMWGKMVCYENIAQMFLETEQLDSATYFYQQALREIEEYNFPAFRHGILLGMAKIAAAKGNPREAVALAEESYHQLSESASLPLEMSKVAHVLQENYAALNDYSNAYKYSMLYQQVRDTLFEKERTRAIGKLEAQHEYNTYKLAQEKEQLAREWFYTQHIETQRIYLFMVVSILFLLLIAGALQWRAHHLLRLKNETLSMQQREILLLNENLEVLVEKRTKALKERGERLERYATMNAHNVRGPVARLLGLKHLFERNDGFENEEEKKTALKALSDNIEELDAIIRKINEELTEQ